MARHPLSFPAKQNQLNPVHHVKLGVRARCIVENAWTSTGGLRRVEGLKLLGWMVVIAVLQGPLPALKELWKLWASSLELN